MNHTNKNLHSIKKLKGNIEKVIIGKGDTVDLCLMSLFAGGHVLFEDVPGVGKTMLVRALAKSIEADFKRIQFTSDLLPSDVTGSSIYNPKSGEFDFRAGPILSNIVLADEINRASPKTQSALLEGMGEHHVTVDGETYLLPAPFLVFATQNPIDYEGTSPLPEAQLDRFLFKIHLDYPNPEEEVQILLNHQINQPIDEIQSVLSTQEIVEIMEEVRNVHVSRELLKYIVDLAHKTRKNEHIALGVSPRGSIALMKAAQSCALIKGRTYMIPDDVQFVLPYVFNHRIILKQEAIFKDLAVEDVVNRILAMTPCPIEREK